MPQRFRSRVVYLLVLPVLLVVAGLILGARAGPHYLGTTSDPDYPYLFNSLNILKLTPPRHIDHPGTTLQLLGAIVIGTKWLSRTLVDPQRPLDEAVLAKPEEYLGAIRLMLSLLLGVVVFVCAWVIYSQSDSMLAAVGFQAAVWLSAQVAIAQTRVSPEPLLLVAACAFFIPFIPALFCSENAAAFASPRRACLAGVLLAFGVATKITFLPLGIFALLWYPNRRLMIRFVVSFLCGLMIFTAPIILSLPKVGFWLLSVLLHKGHYGSGELGLPSLEIYFTGMRRMFHAEPFLVVELIYFLILLISVRMLPSTSQVRAALRFLMVASITITAQLAITAKHPAVQYLVPVVLVPALAAAVLIAALPPEAKRSRSVSALLSVGVLVFVSGLAWTMGSVREWLSTREAYRREVRSIMQAAAKEGCVMLGFYRSSLPNFALDFGSEWSGRVHEKALMKLYPELLVFNIYLRQFSSHGQRIELSDIERRLQSGACMLAEGDPRHGGLSRLAELVNVTTVYTGAGESLYRISSKDRMLEDVRSQPAKFRHANLVKRVE